MQNAPPSPTSPTSPVPPQNKRTRFTSALSALAHLATAAREPPPPRPPPDEAELRRLWRPVAAWRVAARRAGADDAAAADAALAMWAALAGRSFLGKVKAAPAPRGLALGLARALAGLPIAPRDDAAALAAAVHAAVTDVVAARADEVDAAAALAAAAATVDELTRAVRLARDAFGQPPDAATTDFWRPPPAPPSPVRDFLNQPRPLSNDSGLAEAHAAHVARAHLPRLCAWRGALTAGDDVDAQLRRCYFGGAVAPDGGGLTSVWKSNRELGIASMGRPKFDFHTGGPTTRRRRGASRAGVPRASRASSRRRAPWSWRRCGGRASSSATTRARSAPSRARPGPRRRAGPRGSRPSTCG